MCQMQRDTSSIKISNHKLQITNYKLQKKIQNTKCTNKEEFDYEKRCLHIAQDLPFDPARGGTQDGTVACGERSCSELGRAKLA